MTTSVTKIRLKVGHPSFDAVLVPTDKGLTGPKLIMITTGAQLTVDSSEAELAFLASAETEADLPPVVPIALARLFAARSQFGKPSGNPFQVGLESLDIFAGVTRTIELATLPSNT